MASSSTRVEIQDEEAKTSFMSGKRDVLLHNYQSACDHLSKACERLVQLHGSDTAPELAEPYFYYGQALLYLGLSEQQVFGSDLVKDADNDENENEEEEKEEEEVEEEEEQKEGENSGENAEDSIPDDEHVNDLERAFEILECAHMIFSKMAETSPGDAHTITRLADLHVMLGDICNENGDHETALSHVIKAIELQETLNDEQRHRLLAESYYKLGLIYELINKFSEAVESFDKALTALRRAIEQINDDEQESEREELKNLLPAIELKRNDAQASIADRHLIAQAGKIIAGTSTNGQAAATTDSSAEAAPVKDLTLSIRHKRPAITTIAEEQENQDTTNESKRPRLE